MFVERLELRDFRNYEALEVHLDPGVTIFQGSNGQGKTNLVEAVEYLSRLESHRVSHDLPLVRKDCDQAIVRAVVQAGIADTRRLLLELEINPHQANRARLNRGSLSSMREILGLLRTVVFSPEDLAVVKADPATRRRFLDDVVISRWPRMLGVKTDYDKVIRQRNALLKSAKGKPDESAEFTLSVWDDQLVALGTELLMARLSTVAALNEPLQRSYEQIAPVNNLAQVSYKSSIFWGQDQQLDVCFREALVARRADEWARGVTLVGPHRDDLDLSIGDLPAKGYASHGESWSLALALRLASFQLLRTDGIEAVLILDDVFAELDEYRRVRLAGAVADAEQLLITVAVASDVPPQLTGQRYAVKAGTLACLNPAREESDLAGGSTSKLTSESAGEPVGGSAGESASEPVSGSGGEDGSR